MTKKILCAVDDTEHARHAIGLAAEMASAMGAELTLLAVNELMPGGKGSVAAFVWDDAELKRVLDSAVSEAKSAGVAKPKAASAKSRDVPRAIVTFAEDNGFDHIIIGSSGKGGLKRLMLGSVSRDVVFRAHCPVTVVR